MQLASDYQRGAFVPTSASYGSERFHWATLDKYPHHYFAIDDDEFYMLFDSGVIWNWNERYDTYLDEFEIGIFDHDLEVMHNEVIDSIGEGAISKALGAAIDEGTGVYFLF